MIIVVANFMYPDHADFAPSGGVAEICSLPICKFTPQAAERQAMNRIRTMVFGVSVADRIDVIGRMPSRPSSVLARNPVRLMARMGDLPIHLGTGSPAVAGYLLG